MRLRAGMRGRYAKPGPFGEISGMKGRIGPIIEAYRREAVLMAKRMRMVISAVMAAGILVSISAWPAPPETVQDKPAAQAEMEDAANIGKVIITTSGAFRRDKETVIRYRKSDLSVLSVTVNGQDIPPDRFDRYKDELMKALEYPRLRNLVERVEAIQKSLKSITPLDRDQRARLDSLLGDLEKFLAEVSPANKSVLDPLHRKLADAAFEKLIREFLLSKKLLSPDEEVRLVMRMTGCAVNGRDLPADVSAEILRIWDEYQDVPLKAGQTITYIFDPVREPERPSPE